MKLKNKYGFTLIELLAVIVVLAIIALIATPIVMNTIKKAKKGAAERSADSYVKQVETAVAEERLSKNEVLEGEYQITSDGNLCRNKSASCSDDKKIKIEMNGTKPTSGKIKITNGGVDQSSSSMTIGNYTVSYNSTKKTYEAIEKGNTPQVEVLCTAKTTATTGNVPSGNYAYGDEYTCELGDNDAKTFFVLETNGDNVSLIMDRNIDSNGKGTTSGNTVVWISDEDWAAAGGVVTDAMKNDGGDCQYGGICLTNEYGPITAQNFLKNSTTSWTKLTESQISLPSYDQIYKATGNKTSGLSAWLYGNLNNRYAYWTSTPYASDSRRAWYVFFTGFLNDNHVGSGDIYGVRPVITVSKANLS